MPCYRLYSQKEGDLQAVCLPVCCSYHQIKRSEKNYQIQTSARGSHSRFAQYANKGISASERYSQLSQHFWVMLTWFFHASRSFQCTLNSPMNQPALGSWRLCENPWETLQVYVYPFFTFRSELPSPYPNINALAFFAFATTPTCFLTAGDSQ